MAALVDSFVDSTPLGRDNHGRRIRYRLLPRGAVELLAFDDKHGGHEAIQVSREQLDLIAEHVTAMEAKR